MTLAMIEFTHYAIIWWDQLVTSMRKHERPVKILNELRAIMSKRFFVANHYYRDLYQKL